MATVDFTTYTEVDPNSHISTTSARASYTGLTRAETAYLYKDYGANHFDGDFEHLFVIYASVLQDGFWGGSPWNLANDLGSCMDLYNANKWFLTLMWNTVSVRLYLRENTDSGLAIDTYEAAVETLYYIKMKRDESVGTYGTLYCYIYSDSARTTLLDTLALTLRDSKKDFRYHYAIQSADDGGTATATGYVENLDLQEAPAPDEEVGNSIFFGVNF